MVPKPARKISQTGETGPAEVYVAEWHRSRQRRVQSRDRYREGGGTLAEESGDATRRLEQRAVVERDQTDRQPESGERETHGWHKRRLTQRPGKQRRRRHLGLLQSQAFLGGPAALPVRPVAAENREPLLNRFLLSST